MTLKKIDWVRHLYHESTKWENALSGQVKWRDIGQKDPNNGAKFTVKTLEELLPQKLTGCLESGSVPTEYLPEVNYCLAYLRKEKSFDTKAVAEMEHVRKECLQLFITFHGLGEVDVHQVLNKIHGEHLEDLLKSVRDLKHRLSGLENCNGPVEKAPERRAFKSIDWLRHLFRMCQKWLCGQNGQVKWKESNAVDPNNSKVGSRMKRQELVDQLMTQLLECQEAQKVPKPYQAEVQEFLLTTGAPDTKKVEIEERTRKIALHLVDTFLEDKFGEIVEEVLAVMSPSKIKIVSEQVANLEERLREHLHLEPIETEEEVDNLVEPCPSPDCLEETGLEDVAPPEVDYLQEIGLEDVALPEVDISQEGEAANFDDDGTSALMALIDQAVTNQSPSMEPVPSPTNDVSSGVLSPGSVHDSSDGHVSDDSGYSSPHQDIQDSDEDQDLMDDLLPHINPEDLLDPDVQSLANEIHIDDILSSIDQDQDVSTSRKRKHEEDTFDLPERKRTRP